MLANRILDFFTSLRLTVVCLALALVLVFIGTIAQVKLGLYTAQENYFQSLFVYWTPQGSNFRIPVWPGGYLLGWILLINLIAAHIRRFTFSKKKIGIFLVHAGLILLLLGQFFTEMLQVESHMRLVEGSASNFSEAARRHELAIIDKSDPNSDFVVSIPEALLARGGEIKHPDLPFPVRVHSYWQNSEPLTNTATLSLRQAPPTTKMNDKDVPYTEVEFGGASDKRFKLSAWFSDDHLSSWARRNLEVAVPPGFERFEHNGKSYEVTLRSERYYKPHYIELVDFTHDRYRGTEIPKNFSSRIQLKNPETSETREVLIYMNNPLRYGGETYYQGSFDQFDERVSILQVVRNPSWLTPYVSCILVGVGLTVQFMSHLVGFAKKRKAAAA
ncbi:MAG TPA: cytochrome c biogenesis protein ResB [Methylomirabilota bacterium]|nr:cytochrome c biogenesis protein ResB [Methylomirabilota bacterium]